ncbi:catalase [Nocardia sp. NPDC058058]|uniref:catalase n=1 Tax=Nocardia sp. NPDC058058 TaxID=3346317 RepID=UPI0036D90BB7
MTTEKDFTAGESAERMAELLPAEPHTRLLHSRGTAVTGVFHAEATAAELSTAAIFAGGPVPVVGRFSGTRGDAHGHDAHTGDQGLSVRFALPGEPVVDLTAFTLPVFFVRSGADMLEFFAAIAPDPGTGAPKPEAMTDFTDRHPEAAAALAAGSGLAPASYVSQRYHAIHAFGFIAHDGTQSWARLEWHPEVGLTGLDPVAAGRLPADYLARDLARRLPAHFGLYARLAVDGDAVHDPTALWADPPRLLRLGRLRLDRVIDDHDLDFDPLRLPTGMTAPRDRLAADRSAIYAAARRRRIR